MSVYVQSMFSLCSVYVPFEGFGKLTFTPRSPYCITFLEDGMHCMPSPQEMEMVQLGDMQLTPIHKVSAIGALVPFTDTTD